MTGRATFKIWKNELILDYGGFTKADGSTVTRLYQFTTDPNPKILGPLKKRLSWEITMEYGFNARVGRTLDKVRCSTAHLDEGRPLELKPVELERDVRGHAEFADRGDQRFHRRRRQFRAGPLADQQLGAAGIEFGRAAFVILDMGLAMADDAAMRRAERGQGEAVRGRAGRHPKRLDIALEQSGEGRIQPLASLAGGPL
jgi:hypothetical protein